MIRSQLVKGLSQVCLVHIQEAFHFHGPFFSDFNSETICEELRPVSFKWFKIGIQLGLPHKDVKRLTKEDQESSLKAIIEFWMAGDEKEWTVPINWQSVVQALRSDHVGEAEFAKQVYFKFCRKNIVKVDKGMLHVQ